MLDCMLPLVDDLANVGVACWSALVNDVAHLCLRHIQEDGQVVVVSMLVAGLQPVHEEGQEVVVVVGLRLLLHVSEYLPSIATSSLRLLRMPVQWAENM